MAAAAVECLLSVAKALGMGSCLSLDEPSGPPRPGARRRRRRPRLRRSASEGELLQGFPGRMILNGANGVASLFTQQGMKGLNQDAMIVWENFGFRNGTIFCGVFDGHGPHGHKVARTVRDILPVNLSSNWENEELAETNAGHSGSITSGASSTLPNEEITASIAIEEDNSSHIFRLLKDSLLMAFRTTDKELKQNPNIDCSYSGTTAVTLVKQGQQLVIGNVGDSRAVIGTRDKSNSLIAEQLTVDLKPNLPSEAERIRRCRGRVFALRDEPDVARVWLPNKNIPGLAMARALGDFCLKEFGLISVPEVSYRHLTEKDEFIVIATDGIWDVLSNQEVVDIVASAPARSSAAEFLVKSAVKAWKYKYPTSRIDDCAIICLFLNVDAPDTCSNVNGVGAVDAIRLGNDDKEPCSCTTSSTTTPGTNHSGTGIQQDEEIPQRTLH